MGGSYVETASNGQQALDKINAGRKSSPSMTDTNMPVMGGAGLDCEGARAALLPFSSNSHAYLRKRYREARGRQKPRSYRLVRKPTLANNRLKVIKEILQGTCGHDVGCVN